MTMKDYCRYTDKKGIKGYLHAYFSTANYRVIFWFRLREILKNIPILSMIINLIFWRISFNRDIEIPKSVSIAEGFYIIHSGTAIINSQSKIGKNFTAVSSFNLGGVLN